MVLLLMRVIGIGIDTADMLVKEVLSRNLRDRRAVARYEGLTGSPDESGKKRREKGLAVRQCSGATGNDPASVAFYRISKGQHAGQVVSSAHRERSSPEQEDDRRPGSQAARRLVALRA